MTLASIHSEAENSKAKSTCGGYCWIGGYRKGSGNNFGWEDGSSWDFNKWNPGEPNDWGGNEDCAQLYSNGNWNDNRCDISLAAICRSSAGAGTQLPPPTPKPTQKPTPKPTSKPTYAKVSPSVLSNG